MLVRILLFVALISTANAQTFIVDAANGPGTNFTDIATAASTVPDGAIIMVRAGSYLPFAITNKGLSVLCDSGVIVTAWPPITISGTSAVQTVELRGLQVPNGTLSLTACQGTVLLYDCTVANWPQSGQLQATGCAHLEAVRCFFGNALQNQDAMVIDGSVAVLSGCTVASGFFGINLRSSSLQLTDCAVSLYGYAFLVPAIGMTNGDVRIIGGSLFTIWLPCIAGTGTARTDPSTQGASFAPSVLGTIFEMPAVVTTGGALGSTVTVTMRGPGGSVGALLAGTPGTPYAMPGILDPIWLQPGTEAVCFFTVFAAGVPVPISRPVPSTPVLRGLRVAWQGFTYDASAGLQASPPAITSHW